MALYAITGMPAAIAAFVGSTKAVESVSATAIPSAPPLMAVSKALTISETTPLSDPVHCGVVMPSSAAASSSP